jgi:hypothetical protein
VKDEFMEYYAQKVRKAEQEKQEKENKEKLDFQTRIKSQLNVQLDNAKKLKILKIK